MSRHSEPLRQLLAQGPTSPRLLLEKLGISQPTLSRAITSLGTAVLRFGAGRSIQYALRDPWRGLAALPVYRVDAEGRIARLGDLHPIRPDGFVMQQDDGQAIPSAGLPWWLMDMRPQGFLGRAYAMRHAEPLGLPMRVSEWSDTHTLRALQAHGHDAVGNLLLGDLARERFLTAMSPTPISQSSKGHAYLNLAVAAANGDVLVSSAGGEQPKFATFADTPVGPRHLLVKFTVAEDNPVTERWRDLLVAEHVALETLRSAHIPAARSWLIDHGSQRFLEVERFDRVGHAGRRGLISLAALDAEFVGNARAPWPVLVRSLAQQGVVTPDAVELTDMLFAFGRLIGNTDMHAGNLSFINEQGRPYILAPAYDMLPMGFAPTSGGALPQHLQAVDLHASIPHAIWPRALQLARSFYARLQGAEWLSARFAGCLADLGAHLDEADVRISRLG